MGKNLKIKLNRAGVEALLTSDEMKADLARRAKAIEVACNNDSTWGGYASSASNGGKRARAKVWSYGAHDDESRQQRLVKNLDAGRD